jgi:hypothetical protein
MSRSAQAIEVPTRYLAALDRLASAISEARVLAEVLDHFAHQLRVCIPGLEGLPLELFPSAAGVRRALQRRDRALDEATEEWERLPADARELFSHPSELLADEVLG